MRKYFFCFLFSAASFFTTKSFAQNVAINEDGSAANPNAILDIQSFTKGILIPRVSTTGRLAMPAVKGMLVFDTTAGAFFYNVPIIGWQRLATGTSASEPGANWSVTGNNITDVNNFLGTVNNAALRIRVNNQLSGLIEPDFGNTFWGYNSGKSVNPAVSIDNTGIGFMTLPSSTGSSNTASGAFALSNNTSGAANTANGLKSMLSNTTGGGNTASGFGSLRSNTTGFNNTAIGFSADVSTGDLSNATAIGSGAIVDASNKVRIGNSAVTVIEGQVPFTTPSDGRFKYQVKEDVKGLDFIMQLRPVTYQFDVKRFDDQMRGNAHSSGNGPTMSGAMQASYNEAAAIRRTGFIAQEVEKAANATGYNFSGIIKPKTNEDHYSLSYESFVVPLVKAVQEQQEIIKQQDKKMTDLQQQINELKQLVQHSK